MLARLNRIGSIAVTPLTAGDAASTRPSIDPSGRRIVFLSAADLLGLEIEGTQAYGYDTKAGELTAFTSGPAGAGAPTAATGVFAGFSSADDLIGNDNASPQFFVINPSPAAPAP
jgi:hypothetical protein